MRIGPDSVSLTQGSASGPFICGAPCKEDIVLSEDVEAAKSPVSTGGTTAAAEKGKPGSELLALILSNLEKDKAEDVISIALQGKSEMADYMVVASGRSTRQVVAMSEKLNDALKEVLGRSCRIEGRQAGDWVLLDCGDVIVHIFRPEVREFYQLEKMWLPAAIAAESV